jgi:hypothetical protein
VKWACWGHSWLCPPYFCAVDDFDNKIHKKTTNQRGQGFGKTFHFKLIHDHGMLGFSKKIAGNSE